MIQETSEVRFIQSHLVLWKDLRITSLLQYVSQLLCITMLIDKLLLLLLLDLGIHSNTQFQWENSHLFRSLNRLFSSLIRQLQYCTDFMHIYNVKRKEVGSLICLTSLFYLMCRLQRDIILFFNFLWSHRETRGAAMSLTAAASGFVIFLLSVPGTVLYIYIYTLCHTYSEQATNCFKKII